ncbi:MAG: 16S rRNA (guanine(966)-N(2))-methyltransferase RsmD [Victivallaceae bacterium]
MRILSGQYRGILLKSFKSVKIRPTSGLLKECFFNICRGYIEGAHFLDLFAGTGVVGLEALSQGASSAVFVDSSHDSVRIIKENLKRVKPREPVKIISKNVFCGLKYLAGIGASFDIIYIDPPYENIPCIVPNLLEQIVNEKLLVAKGVIFVESHKDYEMRIPSVLSKVRFKKLGSSGFAEYRLRLEP